MLSDWNELKKFFTHYIFYVPLFIIIIFELFLRTGIYNSFLKPLSYAANIIRIKKIIKESNIDPNVLIVGTSVPYQGLLVNILNDKSKVEQKKVIFQSVATQGAFLITQSMLLNYAIEERKHIKYVIHFADIDFPWQERYELELSNRSMLSQFEINQVIDVLKENQYHIKPEDYRFFYIKILTYQKDLRNFFLDPYGRLKSLARHKKNLHPDYAFINNNYYSIGSYGNTVEECILNASKGIPFFKDNQQITDEPHRTAVLDTCNMANYNPYDEPGRYTWEKLFELRLKYLYSIAKKNNIKIITILPPYSIFMESLRKDHKVEFWKSVINKIDPSIIIIDHRFVLDNKDNLEFFYDTIHLNRRGAEIYTEHFYKSIMPFLEF